MLNSSRKDTVDINAPHSSIVSVKCAKSFAIERVPDIGLRVFSTGEDKITLTVVLDLRY